MRTTAAGSPDGSEPTSGTWATTAMSPLPVCNRTRASLVRRAAVTAERSSSVPSVSVTTAPGSTVDGIEATGRRTALGIEIVGAAESVMERKSIDLQSRS